MLARVAAGLASLALAVTLAPDAAAVSSATPAEQRWGLRAADWADSFATFLDKLSNLAGNQTKVTLLLLGDPDTTIEAAAIVVVIRQCGPSYRRDVGPGPTGRTRYISKIVLRACGKFNLSMNLFVRGVDSIDAGLIERSTAAMLAGSRILTKATRAVGSLT